MNNKFDSYSKERCEKDLKNIGHLIRLLSQGSGERDQQTQERLNELENEQMLLNERWMKLKNEEYK
jgi:predicted nuclease with TOPRIM domain